MENLVEVFLVFNYKDGKNTLERVFKDHDNAAKYMEEGRTRDPDGFFIIECRKVI